MSEETGLDVVGIGKLAKAIPQKAWVELVHTACETFSKCVAPLTETTSGVGRLVQAKFDRLIDEQKVLASETMAGASRKAFDALEKTSNALPNARSRKSSRRASSPSSPAITPQVQAPVVVAALEHASLQSDATLRELWSNLLAQEILTGSVHPEFPAMLARISPHEARVLAEVARNSKSPSKRRQAFVQGIEFSFGFFDAAIGAFVPAEPRTFSHEHLRMLNLIERRGNIWILSVVGEEFVAAVSDPTLM